MKKIILILLIPALAFMTSCGGSDDDGFMSQMKKIKEVADNAKEMQEEMDAHPEDNDAVFTEHRLDQLGITNTENKISDEQWNRVQTTVNDFLAMDSTEMMGLNHEKIAAFYADHGYADVEEGQNELEEIGQLSQFMIEWGMHFVAVTQVQLIDGKEAAEAKTKEYGVTLIEKGLSKEDLKNIEKNIDLEVKALTVFFTIQNYDAIKEVTATIDSLNQIADSLQEGNE